MLAVQITKMSLDVVSRETQYSVDRLKRGYISWYCLSDEGRSWELMSPKEFVLKYRFTDGAVSNRFSEVKAIKR